MLVVCFFFFFFPLLGLSLSLAVLSQEQIDNTLTNLAITWLNLQKRNRQYFQLLNLLFLLLIKFLRNWLQNYIIIKASKSVPRRHKQLFFLFVLVHVHMILLRSLAFLQKLTISLNHILQTSCSNSRKWQLCMGRRINVLIIHGCCFLNFILIFFIRLWNYIFT